MRIHSDIITTETIRAALANCQKDGRVGKVVGLATLTQHRSTKRANAFEVQLGSAYSDSFRAAGIDYMEYSDAAKKRASRRHVRQWADRDSAFPYAPTWHEWGHFIAELFALDSGAIIGGYDGMDSFDYQTGTTERSAREIDWALDYNGRAFDFMEWQARTSDGN